MAMNMMRAARAVYDIDNEVRKDDDKLVVCTYVWSAEALKLDNCA
jgi:hypothetical protein